MTRMVPLVAIHQKRANGEWGIIGQRAVRYIDMNGTWNLGEMLDMGSLVSLQRFVNRYEVEQDRRSSQRRAPHEGLRFHAHIGTWTGREVTSG
jgi:hypothetical protein